MRPALSDWRRRTPARANAAQLGREINFPKPREENRAVEVLNNPQKRRNRFSVPFWRRLTRAQQVTRAPFWRGWPVRLGMGVNSMLKKRKLVVSNRADFV
jgi:hypothetical protein